VKSLLKLALFVPLAVYGQTREFEAASIHPSPPREGFHFSSDSSSGGPGTPDPGMYRCSGCTLATLILKAFDLQNYQFPGRTSLGSGTFDVKAKVPEGATAVEFQAMFQNLLKERFGLTYHFQEKSLRGYHLVIAKSGSKLKESGEAARPPAVDQHGSETHAHSGVIAFGGTARYKAADQSVEVLARLLSDQLNLPVDDRTGLQGKYDFSLTWSGTGAQSGNHTDGAWSGAGHSDHGGGGPSAGSDAPGPTLFDALQSQLGLRLIPSEQTVARMFVIDHVRQQPTEN
jgi:uncharacterized protein (TIGR03435 family)